MDNKYILGSAIIIIVIIAGVLLLNRDGTDIDLSSQKEIKYTSEAVMMGEDDISATTTEDVATTTEEVVEESEPEIPAQYVVLKPEFVVSFQVGPRQRFLQASIEVMTRKQTVVDALTLHEPMIRNDIIRIMGEQDFNQLRTAEGRVALQKQLLKHLQGVMKREAGSPDVEAVLFTNFVMQ